MRIPLSRNILATDGRLEWEDRLLGSDVVVNAIESFLEFLVLCPLVLGITQPESEQVSSEKYFSLCYTLL